MRIFSTALAVKGKEMTNSDKKHVVWTDSIRIIAVFFVILLHASAFGFRGYFGARSWEWQICNFFDALSRFCVPVFVMVSGVFLLDPAKEYDLRKIYFSKILRIVTAYIIWSFSYSLIKVILLLFRNEIVLDINLLYLFLRYFILGEYHLWFLFMITGLYVVTPFLRLIVKNEKLTIYFLVLSFFLVFTINTLSLFPIAKKVFSVSVARLNINFVAGYSGYFLLGYWLSKHRIPSAVRKVIYILGVLAALGTAGLNGFIGYHLNKIGAWLFDNLSLNVLLTSSAVFIFCQYNLDYSDVLLAKPEWSAKIKLIGKLSFGIYLVHVFILEALYMICFQYYICYPALFIIFGSVITFFVSLAVVFLLSKVPLIKKYAL